eukprot:5324301-Alexandrium_andersonii.AAC.1
MCPRCLRICAHPALRGNAVLRMQNNIRSIRRLKSFRARSGSTELPRPRGAASHTADRAP